MVAPASLHILTPGSPAYTVAKVGAVGGLFALRVVLTRRQRRQADNAATPAEPAAPPRHREPHPVSRKKRRRKPR